MSGLGWTSSVFTDHLEHACAPLVLFGVPEDSQQRGGPSMRLVNVGGRAQVAVGDGVVDVARGSGGRLPADPMAAFAAWGAVAEWAAGLDARAVEAPLDEATVGPPVPRPSKVF